MGFGLVLLAVWQAQVGSKHPASEPVKRRPSCPKGAGRRRLYEEVHVRAVIVYESLWGNTAAVARAIAEGFGPGAQAYATVEAGKDVLADAELIVAGGPVFAFQLSSERTREEIRQNPGPGAPTPDLSHPSIRAWLNELPAGTAWCAAFDTQVRGPFGKGAPSIAKLLQAKGYRLLAAPEGFIVSGKQGPLRPGELERAHAWGAQLRQLIESP